MCQVSLNVSCSVGSFGLKYHKLLSTLVLLCLAGTVIFTGGLASVQNECHDDGVYAGNTDSLNGVFGFSSQVLSCKKIFRYYWFIAAFEFVVCAIGLYIVCMKDKLASLKGSLLGLFVVATLLFIATANAFVTILDVPLFQSETLRDRSKTAVAGAIITATLNAAVVFVSGYDA